jgi:hypothetical protein
MGCSMTARKKSVESSMTPQRSAGREAAELPWRETPGSDEEGDGLEAATRVVRAVDSAREETTDLVLEVGLCASAARGEPNIAQEAEEIGAELDAARPCADRLGRQPGEQEPWRSSPGEPHLGGRHEMQVEIPRGSLEAVDARSGVPLRQDGLHQELVGEGAGPPSLGSLSVKLHGFGERDAVHGSKVRAAGKYTSVV